MNLELDIKKHLSADDLELFYDAMKSDFGDFSISIDTDTFLKCCDDIVISNNLEYIQATLCCIPREVVFIKSHKLPLLIRGMEDINNFGIDKQRQWKIIPGVRSINNVNVVKSMLFICENSILKREKSMDTLEEYIHTKHHIFTILDDD